MSGGTNGRARKPASAILAVPLVAALCSAAGLAAGLMGDGWHDIAASLGLGVAPFAIGWGLWRSRRQPAPVRPIAASARPRAAPHIAAR